MRHPTSRVWGLLPERNGEFEYCIYNEAEPYGRVTEECEPPLAIHPMEISSSRSAQYRQIALWTNRGNTFGKVGLKALASIRAAIRSRISRHRPG
jgi:hypothetical protein